MNQRTRRLAPSILVLGLVTLALSKGTAGDAREEVKKPSIFVSELDQKLLDLAPPLIEKLQQELKLRTIGVLRFRVAVAGKKASFDAGSLPANLAARLENALILNVGSDEKSALGILQDPSLTLRENNIASWFDDPRNRARMFDLKYPLAWGKKTVKADAFLTGLVLVDAKYRKATVTVEAFLSADPGRMIPVGSFSFEPDLPLLHDLGRGYTVKAALGPPETRTARGIRGYVLGEMSRAPEEENTNPKDPQEVIKLGPINYQFLADDKPLSLKVVSEAENKYELECPEPNRKLTMKLVNNGSDNTRLGVSIKLNDKSAIFGTRAPAEECRLFVTTAGKKYPLIKGQIVEKEADKEGSFRTEVIPFAILSGEAEQRITAEVGDKAGLIEIAVFAEGSGEEMEISLRSLTAKKERTARHSLETLQDALFKEGKLTRRTVKETVGGKPREREIVAVDEAAVSREIVGIKVVDFKKVPAAVAVATIRVTPRAP